MTNYKCNPSHKVMEILGQHVLSSAEDHSPPRETITLERVDYQTRDQIISVPGSSFEGYFYQVKKLVNRPRPKSIDPNMLFQSQIYLMPYKVEYVRRIYGIQNLMSECGGFLKALMIVCIVINYPISRHLFYIHIIKQLFYARTSDETLMKPIPPKMS